MKQMHQLDNPQYEMARKRHFAFRLNVFFFVIFLLFSALIIRLAFLQFVQGTSLKQMENSTSTVSIPIAPIRGRIYDRDGYPIAYTSSVQSLFYRVEPGQKEDEVIALAKRLSKVLNERSEKNSPKLTPQDVITRMDVGYDIDQNERKIIDYYSSPRRIKENLSHKEIAYLLEHKDEFPGLEVAEESVRQYDPQQIAVQLIGYLRPYSVAKTSPAGYLDFYHDTNSKSQYLNDEYVGYDGLEFMYQNELRGKNGSKTYPVNALSKIIGQPEVVPPVKGDNLYLSLQKDVQLTAEKAIQDQLEFMKSDQAKQMITPYRGHNAVAGYAVAMEVKTGKIVAMANYPTYDPNKWRGGISSEEYKAIQKLTTNGTIRERYADLPDDEFWKHPSSLIPPGSSIKPLTSLLGLNEGLITPEERFQDSGCFYFGKANSARICNSDRHAYGNINVSQAIEHSSNTFMGAMVGNRLYLSSKIKNPLTVWDQYMKQFGLGVSTQSGLPGESSGDIYYFKDAEKYQAQSPLVLGAFGQEARYTTLQLAQYAVMLANHGKRMKPLFVDRITDYDNHTIETVQPQVLNEAVFPDKYWKAVEDGMSKVFVTGFDGFKYNFLRKTGTSQSDIAGKKPENGIFIAYAPAENPKLAVAVVIPEGGYGAWSAAPIARKIFDAYDKTVGLTDKPEATDAANK